MDPLQSCIARLAGRESLVNCQYKNCSNTHPNWGGREMPMQPQCLYYAAIIVTHQVNKVSLTRHTPMVVNCMQLLVTHSSWGGCQNKSCMGSSSDSPSKSLAMRGQTYLCWGGRIGHAVHIVQGHGYVLYFCWRIFCGLFTRQWTTTVKLTNLFQIVIASLIPRFLPRTNEKPLFCIASDRKLGLQQSTICDKIQIIHSIMDFSEHINNLMVFTLQRCYGGNRDTATQRYRKFILQTVARALSGFFTFFTFLIFFVQVHSLHCEVDFQCGNRVSTL